MAHALVVDKDKESVTRISRVFSGNDFSVDAVGDPAEARDAILRKMPEVVLVNLNGRDQAGDREAIFEFLSDANLGNVIEIYLMSGSPSYKLAAEGMRAGSSDIFEYPRDLERLDLTLKEFRDEMACDSDPEQHPHKSGRGLLRGNSAPMRRLYRLIRKVSASDVTVFLAGESGTGKEVIAKTIHELGNRNHCPFVAVNCGAISPDLAESEIFGHVKGAFTGASKSHKGYFEQAEGGTLFLDEITEMTPELQVKMLRVLESESYRPVGAEKDLTADVRILASTNRDPEQAVAEKKLREDLYYRLAQFPIRVPSLRERGEDVVLLAKHFLGKENEASGQEKAFNDEVLEILRLHHWPGNVRELKNLVSRAHLIAGTEITVDDLPSNLLSGEAEGNQFMRLSVGQSLEDMERRMIFATLEHYDGDKKQAAEVLGISLKTLYNRLKKYNLE